MIDLKDRIDGMFLGIAIGDALGMPVETFSSQEIQKKHGRITEYHSPKIGGHKYYNEVNAGTTTDDTQLTLAVAEGIIAANGLDMEEQAKSHVAAYRESTLGWGRSTKESVRNLANGSHWSKSATNKGLGNGVAMKVAPVGILLNESVESNDKSNFRKGIHFLIDLAKMTHKSNVAIVSGIVQAVAVSYCLRHENPNEDFVSGFSSFTTELAKLTEKSLPPDPNNDARMSERLAKLVDVNSWDVSKIIDEFGAGSCYCFDSLPFTFAFFLQNPFSIDSLYDVVSAGGDTDSNGSMLGALLGVLNGSSIFPKNLIDGLRCKDKVLDVSNRFYESITNS